MPRPPKIRTVEYLPSVRAFRPDMKNSGDVEEIILSVEELEAVRLKDIEGLEQEECAESMRISRPTFRRVLMYAREKIARALVYGKVLKIKGGSFELAIRNYACQKCGNVFEMAPSNPEKELELECPECESFDIRRFRGRGRWQGGTPWNRGNR